MSETIDKTILELRELLTSGNSNIDIDADGKLIFENYETKCGCCGYVLANTKQDELHHHMRYMKCPNCGYIQCVPNLKRVPPFWIYKIVDDKGKDILDFKGDCRLFEGKDKAEKYIAFCNMAEKWMPVKVQRYS